MSSNAFQTNMLPLLPGGVAFTPQMAMNKGANPFLGTLPGLQQLQIRSGMIPQMGGLSVSASLPNLLPGARLGLPGGIGLTTGGLGGLSLGGLGGFTPGRSVLDKITKPFNQNEPAERLKKSIYRDELLVQMEQNRMSRAEQLRLKAAIENIEEKKLQQERDNINYRNDMDPYNRKRRDALQETPKSSKQMRGSQSVVELREPRSGYRRYDQDGRGDRDKSLNSSLNRSKEEGFYQIRDELSKNPKRKQNVVEAYWLGDKQQAAKWDNDWWQNGKYDVVKEGGYWNNGKWIPEDIGDKVKEIIGRELKNMKGKMQQDEVKILEQIKSIKDQSKETDKARIRALEELRKLKSKLHKQTVKEDQRQNYIYDVLFERWKDRERKLEDQYKKFPAVNSFPMELRKSEFTIKSAVKQPGELPCESKVIKNNSVQVMDDMWPQLPTLDDIITEKTNQDIFKAETLNKINSRRLIDLDKFNNSEDAMEKIDNSVYDFLNRESNKQVVNAAVDSNRQGDNLFTDLDVLKKYQEVHLKDYISPLQQFSEQVLHPNISNPHKSVDPLIHKLNALRY